MLVLVTAISGYIGSATALAFLQAGHRVRGTVRSEAKAAAWKAAYPEWREQVEFVVVPDSEFLLLEALLDAEELISARARSVGPGKLRPCLRGSRVDRARRFSLHVWRALLTFLY